jgi:primosomal protein N''
LPGMGPEHWREHLPGDGAGLALADLRDASDAQVLEQVRALADRLFAGGAALSDALGQRYFAHSEPEMQLLRT